LIRLVAIEPSRNQSTTQALNSGADMAELKEENMQLQVRRQPARIAPPRRYGRAVHGPSAPAARSGSRAGV
jgi:hypothetical protein